MRGGVGGIFGIVTQGGNDPATDGSPGGDTSISGTGIINCISYGGSGGSGGGSGGTRAIGGNEGSYLINFTLEQSAVYIGGGGGNGGQGNAGNNFTSGTDGSNGFFYNNQNLSGLSYPISTNYVTYFKPNLSPYNVPNSITLTNWYTFSGGGGGANSNVNNTIIAYTGGGGAGSGGLNGANYYSTGAQPYPSYGGGGGGGGQKEQNTTIAFNGLKGGDGLAVIWFSYTFS